MKTFTNKFNSSKSILKKSQKILVQINKEEKKVQLLSDDKLRELTGLLKVNLKTYQSEASCLPVAYALAKEAIRRVTGKILFDVQLLGAIVLNNGDIAQMNTGEGKTLTSVLPAFFNALQGDGVHIITANEYLAQRDALEMGRIFSLLGLSTSCLSHRSDNLATKKLAYSSDICYGTCSQFAFDYLRDNMATDPTHIVQGSLCYALIDEVDSILIDEARTPMIISNSSNIDTSQYKIAHDFVSSLPQNCYQIHKQTKSVFLTDRGIKKAESFFSISNLSSPTHTELQHFIHASLRANYTLRKNKDYLIKDNQIVIIDEFTGRTMDGRRFSRGLHEALEAKEGLDINTESKTLASITVQNYFRMYKKLSGMTGTAMEQAPEFLDLYNMHTIAIPTNRPNIRIDQKPQLYASKKAKLHAICNAVKECQELGRPVLIGTPHVEESLSVSKALYSQNIPHNLLNASNPHEEASIIAQAGRLGQVTVATNMAGRGTDIELMDKKVSQLGGLLVIGTSLHDSGRIDRQLKGRAGRQGDPGETRMYISLEDDLVMRGDNPLIEELRIKYANSLRAINNPKALKYMYLAQANIESNHSMARRQLLKINMPLDFQSKILYKKRRQVLTGNNVYALFEDMMRSEFLRLSSLYCSDKYPESWNIDQLSLALTSISPHINIPTIHQDTKAKEFTEQLVNMGQSLMDEQAKLLGDSVTKEVMIKIFLKVLDTLWQHHLDFTEEVRDGIYLRSIGGLNPESEYNKELSLMWDKLNIQINIECLSYFFGIKP